MNGIRVQGVFVGHRDAFEALVRACEVDQLDPVIERVYPLEEAADAFKHMKDGGQFGKICIRMGD
jgi:D-arabinose 1-dehydrogenase-like Zn-dependent alcohol dehydrogenase